MEGLIRICSGKNRSALRVAEEQHRGMSRKISGVPYILHPVQVAQNAAGAGADRDVIVACILHDVLEDTDYTPEEMTVEFGQDVTGLVESVTKKCYVPLEDRADEVCRKTDLIGEDAWCVKGSDLLVNMTDLVLDAELHGVTLLDDLFGDRADRKVSHYLHLAEKLSERLAGSRYRELASALEFRASELQTLLDEHRSSSL